MKSFDEWHYEKYGVIPKQLPHSTCTEAFNAGAAEKEKEILDFAGWFKRAGCCAANYMTTETAFKYWQENVRMK